jgi:L-rhamnose isomerase / sugar isomerase
LVFYSPILDERKEIMRISDEHIKAHNKKESARHQETYQVLSGQLSDRGSDVASLTDRLSDFQVAIPSWALGAGGTRFGRFSIGGEPRES